MRVLVVDDHSIVRQGMKQILAEAGIESIGEAGTAAAAFDAIRTQTWDLVILDISLPDRSGLELLTEIAAGFPTLPVLVLTIFAEDAYAPRALRAGAAGFLTKECLPEELVTAVREISKGRRYVSARLAQKLALRFGPVQKATHDQLSNREFQVLLLLGSGSRLTEVAARLGISVKTASTYRTRLMMKLGARTTADLIQYAIRNHLVS